MSSEVVVFVVICAVAVIAYIAYVVRAHKHGTLNFRGRPDVASHAGIAEGLGECVAGLGGCVSALVALLAMPVGLYGLIWIIKRMWKAA